MRHRWAQDIAHDLRTPVAAIRAQLEGMIDGVFERDNARLERLARNLNRLESLAQSFLLLTKIESPDFPVRREAVNLSELLTEITSEFNDRAVAASQPITCSLDTALPAVIAADEGLVVRALHNMLDNALVHGSPGPVEISVVRQDRREADGTHEIHLRVTNAGTLDEAIAENPFDRFARGAHEGGHGLGLSVVLAVAQVHGGSAWAQQRMPNTVTVGFSLTDEVIPQDARAL